MGANAGRRVVVIGAGIAGLTAALSFARTGAQVIVHERAPAITEVGAGLQITPNGAVVLDRLGLGPEMAASGVQANAVVPTDALTGRAIARFDLTQLSGLPYRFFHRHDLITLLAAASRAVGVKIETGRSVAPDDPALSSTLLIGADGLHSATRVLTAGPSKAFFTGQVAWRAVIARPSPPEARIWMAPGCHVVTYPLTGGRTNVVAVQERADWAAEGWNHPDDPANLRAAFSGMCPELHDILAAVDSVNLWGLFRHPVAERWWRPGMAIIGDAAHPTLPFLAQGANLAIEDAYVLARCCDADASLARALPAFEALRKPRVVRAIAAANANAVNYHLSGVKRSLAHLGLRTMGAVAPGGFLRRLDWLYGHDVTGKS